MLALAPTAPRRRGPDAVDVLQSHVNPADPTFKTNRERMQALVDQLSERRERTRQREQAAREDRDREIRALLEMALRKLQEGGP